MTWQARRTIALRKGFKHLKFVGAGGPWRLARHKLGACSSPAEAC